MHIKGVAIRTGKGVGVKQKKATVPDSWSSVSYEKVDSFGTYILGIYFLDGVDPRSAVCAFVYDRGEC